MVVADRVNGRLQWFTLDGKHLETLDGFLLPANVDTFGELMLVPELQARVTLLDGKNKVSPDSATMPNGATNVMKMKARQHPEDCPAGKFLHPHDACFDAARQHLHRRVGGDGAGHEAAEGELARWSTAGGAGTSEIRLA